MVANEEKKKNRIIWIILIFIILIMLVSNKKLKNKAQDLFYRNDKSLQLIDNININWPEQGEIRAYGDKIIKYNGKEILNYNLEGTEVWRKSIEDNGTITYLGKDRIYTTLTTTGKVTAFALSGNQVWTYDANQPIHNIVERSGYLILFTQAGENIEQVNILNKEGKLQANATTSKGKILTCNVSPNHKNFTLVTLDVGDGLINSSIIYYEMNGQEMWRKDYSDQIVYDVLFQNDDNMLVVCDSKIFNLSSKSDLLWSKDVEDELKDIKVGTNSKLIYVLYGQANSKLEIISDNGRTKNKIKLDDNYSNIFIDKKYILLKGNKIIAGVDGNRVNLKYSYKENIKGIGIYNDNVLVFTEKGMLITKPINIDS